jgi:hypothetical protein
MKEREFAKRPPVGDTRANEQVEEAGIEQTGQNPVSPVKAHPQVTPNNILQLQRTIGNQAVQRLLAVQRARLDPTVIARGKQTTTQTRKRKEKFKVELQDRGTKGGYRIKVLGRPGKFSSTTLKALKARYTKLHNKRGTGLLKPKKYSRNHVVPWQTLAKEPRTATRGMDLGQLQGYLKSIDPNSFALKTYRNKFIKQVSGKKLTSAAIADAFKLLLTDRYNDPHNLYINEGVSNASSLNSSGGASMRAARDKLRKLFLSGTTKGKEYKTALEKFLKNSLDFPPNYTQKQKLVALKRFVAAWGANNGKYIINTTSLTRSDYEEMLDKIES